MELENSRESLADLGLRAAAISYDTVDILKNFATRRGIHYPLLSDPGSKVIRAFGLLNTALKPESPIYGVPRPGLVLVDETGVIKDLFFEGDYRERYTIAGVLAAKFGFKPLAATTHAETPHLRVDASASNAEASSGQRITLVVDLALSEGFHVYAPGAGADYIPVRWDITPAESWKPHDTVYPAAAQLNFAGESVPVFSGRFRLTRDITLASEKILRKLTPEHELLITGSFRYQACDDRQCFPPRTIPLEWRIRLEPLDSQRVPAEMRRLK